MCTCIYRDYIYVYIYTRCCLLHCIPLRRHTGRVRHGGGSPMVHTPFFKGKMFVPYLPEEALQCGSYYIEAFGLKCPKTLLLFECVLPDLIAEFWGGISAKLQIFSRHFSAQHGVTHNNKT